MRSQPSPPVSNDAAWSPGHELDATPATDQELPDFTNAGSAVTPQAGGLRIDPTIQALLDPKRPQPVSHKRRARRLARAHDLPLHLALQVARGEMSLNAALLLKPRPAEQHGEQTSRRSAAAWAMPAALVLTVVCVISVALFGARARRARDERSQAAMAQAVRQAVAATELLRDGSGRLVRIVGGDAESVLIAFCRASDRSGGRQPLLLAPLSPPQAGARLGVFRDAHDPQVLYAIRIERGDRARLWVAGSGTGPIDVHRLSDIAPGTPTVKVTLGSDDR